jgi:acetate kinase
MAGPPDVAQIACFDTAFHHTMPRVAQQFALPRAISATGVRRYGFHGLSFEWIARRLSSEAPMLAQGRVVVAHLGAGASLCALDKGVSIATSMGISVLDGLVMATRCGSLDPGVIFYLARLGHSLPAIEDMLYSRSGLLGVSGISGDIRVLLASETPEAREAIALFTYRIAGWLGARLNPSANDRNASRISTDDSPIGIRVMATDEEAMIATHILALTTGANALA